MQVAGDVSARFSKDFTRLDEGKTEGGAPVCRVLLGETTRELSYSVDDSQVLVTTPECLETLLTSAAAAADDEGTRRERWSWAASIERVILDEVHNSFGPDGHVWERILSLVSAPVLALSATIADPAAFGGWLQGLEARRGRKMPECIVRLMMRGGVLEKTPV